MSAFTGDRSLRLRVEAAAPAEWDRFLERVPAAELSATALWTTLAARHYPGAWPLWLCVESPQGELLGGMPLLGQRRWGCTRLQSSFDGNVAGPQIAADLPADVQDRIFGELCRWLAAQIGGRTVLGVITVADSDARRRLNEFGRRNRWQPVSYQSAVLDCRPGVARIEAEVWTKNRRNERNRGLRRGCTLNCERDHAALQEWYRIYLAQALGWAQAPVPLGFLHDLLRGQSERVLLNTVRLGGRIVGGHYCLVSRGRLLPFLSGAEATLASTHFLNTLLYWQDILYACGAGLQAVDFGGCLGRDGLWDFKRRCGGQPEERLQLQMWSSAGRWLRLAAAARRRLAVMRSS